MILLLTFWFSIADLESLYFKGEYGEVIEQAPLVLSDTTLSLNDIIDANKVCAFSLVILGKKEEAIAVFQRLLDIDPDFMLDPVTVSPKIVNIFNEAKNKKQLMMPTTKILRDTIYIERKKPLTALLPGIYQIQKNKKFIGYAMLTTEILSLAGLGISQRNYNRAHDEYLTAQDPQIINDEYEIYNSWYKKRTLFISTSVIIWFYNLIDILYIQ